MNFIDNPRDYAGVDLELPLTFMGRADDMSDGSETLRDSLGSSANFMYYDLDSDASAELTILLPTDIQVPNVAMGDEVVVKFVCKEGSLRQGNVALGAERP